MKPKSRKPRKKILLILAVIGLGLTGYAIGMWKSWNFLKNISMMYSIMFVGYLGEKPDYPGKEERLSALQWAFAIITILTLAILFTWIENNRIA